MLGNPLSATEIGSIPVSKENLVDHIEFLTSLPEPRNYINIDSLNEAADYIDSVFTEYCDSVEVQKFLVNDVEYRNVVCSFGPENSERIIVGAHYDVCGNQPGADDNASAVAGLLEIARLLKPISPTLKNRIDLAAYSLEEPPFFRTKSMGSAIHAKHLKKTKVDVKVMICLESIGYFVDEPNSQQFPIGFLKWFYPTTGNFIGVVSNLKSHFIGRKIRDLMRDSSDIDVEQLTAPSLLSGVDFSDHLYFWKYGYKAVMITDSAFYRNPHYHEVTDTIDTLDFDKMAKVVKGVYSAITALSE